jgi:hypothetical protein
MLKIPNIKSVKYSIFVKAIQKLTITPEILETA